MNRINRLALFAPAVLLVAACASSTTKPAGPVPTNQKSLHVYANTLLAEGDLIERVDQVLASFEPEAAPDRGAAARTRPGDAAGGSRGARQRLHPAMIVSR